MDTIAVLLRAPEELGLERLSLTPPGEEDVVVDVEWSGISTGTERLLWSGRMPSFPGMGYPLVPGYESVGRVTRAGATTGRRVGERVFVPGARCFGTLKGEPVRGLFGGAASRLVVPGAKVVPIWEDLGEQGVLLALAATAYHAFPRGVPQPDLIVGHGVLGRLLARLALAAGAPAPMVWETNAGRHAGAEGYPVLDPAADDRRDYRCIADVSGDPTLLDALIARLAPRGEVVLAGFYAEPLSFSFPPAFMREARIRIAAEWKTQDLDAVLALLADGRLSLDGLITHTRHVAHAPDAYRTAFTDSACLKMVLDWRESA
ncbi:chlorophyll synthesis pathway protein BchC [Paracraurococcus ruber]|uniref:Chlorophyll synthesis pathway protein BchC n=1 Tax=Paracraurococcus ruber TaxID=77675 RepID=A0ABS1CXE3_9PROT|nr:chlorophyll synthesis pathway protein BchC [Paracraurococcus ruber]MBK1659205.1 chlorophyll synthesis pathway protein BchC [Paracraurococcus ruber]TDG30631.1 chlorophyll synthesis pathway protein BchC [Paracraurococcus ruber]